MKELSDKVTISLTLSKANLDFLTCATEEEYRRLKNISPALLVRYPDGAYRLMMVGPVPEPGGCGWPPKGLEAA